MEPRLLTTVQTAEHTGLAKQTLHQKRVSGQRRFDSIR